jgi:hypothetical protein
MIGLWMPSVRAMISFVMVTIALLAFAAVKITTGNGLVSGQNPDWTVVANAIQDTAGFAAPLPDQLLVETLQNPALDDRETGAWFLMIFGFGVVALALRCRRPDSFRCQFA